jgi:hypothetical protein
MRTLITSTAIIAFIAGCSPPAQRPAEAPEAPIVAACNSVAPDAARQVRVEDAVATAAEASDLRGGTIAPGVYDLVRAQRIGAATGWSGTRAVALGVSEDAAGAVTFNWSSIAPDNAVDSWTATFTEAPQPRLAYSCGRMGEVAAEFAVQTNTLELRLQDGANGQLALTFQRRV